MFNHKHINEKSRSTHQMAKDKSTPISSSTRDDVGQPVLSHTDTLLRGVG